MTIYIGIDWSEDHHDVVFLHQNGRRLGAFQFSHNPIGFSQLIEMLTSLGLSPSECPVALETSHNILVDFLLDHHYPVYVVAPTVVKGSRSRFGSSGARTDVDDAHLLADMLRTDQGRLIAWQPNGLLVRQMQAKLRLIDCLTISIHRYGNRLRANLLRYYPQALTLFSRLTAQISLRFLMAYPSPLMIQGLTYQQLAAFCATCSYSHPRRVPKLYAHLRQPACQPDPVTIAAYEPLTPFLAQLLLTLVKQKRRLISEVQQLFLNHPDQAIFASLPGAGELLAPQLLVMFGDYRKRYQSPGKIQALAGTCPVTVQSGKGKHIRFRRSCNRNYRRVAQQFARSSVQQSIWAAGYFAEALVRGLSESHAYRCLANRWLAIIWTLWNKRECYDEDRHLQDVIHYQGRTRPTIERTG